MTESPLSPLDKLQIADPDTHLWIKGRLALISPPPGQEVLTLLVDTTIWGLSLEAGLGKAVAKGILHLISETSTGPLHSYVALVHRAAETGPTLGRIVATFLPAVLTAGDDFSARFQNTLEIMQSKGTYTLTAPLEVMASLLAEGDVAAASLYLDLLATTFRQEISYNQSLRLVYLLPKAAAGFASNRRKSQIRQLHRVAKRDLKLIDPFLDGLARGAGLLDQSGLETFVRQALKRYAHAPESGLKFISLSSKVGQDACAALQRAVPLRQVAGPLNRYLHARLGRPVVVKPLSELNGAEMADGWVCSDGRFIYIPEEIDRFPTQAENLFVYKALVRLEAGYFECGTFDFDLEKAADRYAEVGQLMGRQPINSSREPGCDGQRFIDAFSPRALAADLFDLFEQARVADRLRYRYPGLTRRVMPLLEDQFQRHTGAAGDHLLRPVYSDLVLAQTVSGQSASTRTSELQGCLVSLYREFMDPNSPVEATARLVCLALKQISKTLGAKMNQYTPLAFPFQRRLHWELIGRALAGEEQTARRISRILKEKGVNLYRSDIQTRLAEQNGRLSADDLSQMVSARLGGAAPNVEAIDLSDLDFEALLQQSAIEIVAPPKGNGDAFCYPEWSFQLQDYLYDHTRVYEIEVADHPADDFYLQTLNRHRGLVARMRRAFQLIKPEGLTLLRQWPEGDAFDYRALLDYAMDRRAGLIPSDRLFIKRLKQVRDVAVTLLVDLSRSTANTVSGGEVSVLDVAREALVLFCEALQVVGDDFSISGFSGTGRLSVDYYIIKRFQEPLTEAIQYRLSSLRPQRSTRMGAAVRHACALLAKTDARVRLLIIVSDGFPNDLGYKADYAIADTRRAVQEGRSRNIHVKAITVNIGSDPRLDDLYGRVHHHVIGDVHDLPDKLLRLYGALTRF